MKLIVHIPVKTTTPGNTRTHWRVAGRKAKAQRTAARLCTLSALNALPVADRTALLAAPRVKVLLTRISSGSLDTPNVFGALKHVIDGMADALGRDDGDPWYDWQMPTQERGPVGVRVELALEGSA